MAVIDSAKVRYLPGTRATMRRSRAENSPLRSATAMPNITVRMVASGGKAAKFSTAPSTAMVRLALLSRFCTSMVSCVPGWTALTPTAASTALRTATTPARIQNSQNGLGSLFPTFSIAAKLRNAARRALDRGSVGCGWAEVALIGTSSCI